MADTSSYCLVLPPLIAYGDDFPKDKAGSVEPLLRAWLDVASCLWRIAQLPEVERPARFGAAAEMLAEISSSSPGRAPANDGDPAMAGARALVGVAELFAEAAMVPRVSREWRASLTRAVQEGAEYLERRGAFRLAYTLLASLRDATGLSNGDEGRAIVQQGRVARELGAMQSADDHYRVAERMGRRVGEPDLHVRAVLGRGVIAATRGSYPEARRLFRRGLRAARKSRLPEHEVAAHNALLMAAVAAKDADGALTHGWYLFQHSSGLPDRQAEVLINLAEVALLAGHPESALAACSVALTLTSFDRVLLAGYGTAAVAASRLGRRAVLDMLASESLPVIQRSNQQFDRAYTLLELAEAYGTLGVRGDAGDLLAQARVIAEPAGFYEILHRADLLAARLDEMRAAADDERNTSPRHVPTRTFSIQMTSSEPAAMLSAASRRVIRSLAELRS